MYAPNRSLTFLAFASASLLATFLFGTQVRAEVLATASCESLASLALPNAKVDQAQTVAPGAFVPPTAGATATGGRGAAAARLYSSLPSFCRVTATLTPSPDSDIKVEVWLPMAGWNGKFQAVGNGGWAGVISYPALAQAVAGGYASASTDTGHAGNSGAFALGHPEKVIDFGYRAVHEMTVHAKTIINTYYGNAPRLSLWNGCSQGGRQGITEAQRYPADYDGIVAGAPAVNGMMLHVARVMIGQTVHRSADSYVPPEKYSMIHDAVLQACDAHDSVKDGVLEDPTRCHFDPKVLECKGADSPSCLTSAQVETARALIEPVKHPKTGAVVFPALLQPGSELGWATLAGPQPINTVQDAFKYIVFKDPNWDWRRFNAASDIDLTISSDNGVINSAESNLQPFFSRGGKLLIYQGWADQQVAAMNAVNYFKGVAKATGKSSEANSIQLYMVPGMGHCAGGPGTDTFDKIAAMEQWIDKGLAPDKIIASHVTNGAVDRTRPLCPYGKVAKWNGSGSTDDAANFACVAPPPERSTQ
jgi:Tannase and feruloyl esterase